MTDFSICPVCSSDRYGINHGLDVQDYGTDVEATQSRFCRDCNSEWDIEFKAVDVTITKTADDADDMTEPTPMQNQWVNICVASDQQEQARKTLADGGYLFADVVPCLNGSFSTGSTQQVGSDLIVPLLFLSASEAMEVNRECREEYEADIRDGHRDSDDRYEGEVMLVKWQGDTLSFFTCDEELIGECDVRRAMGTA